MSTEENKTLVRRWWDALNQGNALDIIEATYASDYVLHDPSLPEPVRGVQGVREFIASVIAGFPDARYTIEALIAEGDKVVQHISVRGTHQGEFQGIAATGKPVAIWAMVISRVAQNKVVEEWQLIDSLSMLQQLGVIPPPTQAGE
jgi:steroid delta-isomerase-like uncharacterized protein